MDSAGQAAHFQHPAILFIIIGQNRAGTGSGSAWVVSWRLSPARRRPAGRPVLESADPMTILLLERTAHRRSFVSAFNDGACAIVPRNNERGG